MATLVGLDVGTQAVRALAVRTDGTKLAESVVPLDTQYPAPGRAEQDAEQWWDSAVAALRAVMASPGVDPGDVRALSYACTSCTVIALDRRGRPLRPALLWMDERAAREAREVTETRSPVLRYSGGVVSPQWMLPKLKWLMTHEPRTYAHAHRIVEQTDFFTYRLTGRWTLGYGNLVAKWNYANPCGGWPPGFLEAAGVANASVKWPTEILPLGSPVGRLLTAAAASTGLPRRTLVVQGGIDCHVAMLGTSVVQPGELAMIMGSSTVAMGQAEEPVFANNWGPYPDAIIPGLYTLGGGQSTTGAIVQWLLRTITPAEGAEPAETLAQLESEAATLPPGSEGLVALDYFAGNRTPWKDPDARGLVWGLTLRHGRAHLLRAFYEAISYGSRLIVNDLVHNGYAFRRVVASGGGSRSRLGIEILADVLGEPIELTAEPESTSLGAAIVAGVGAGVFDSYEQAIAALVRPGGVVEPRAANKEVYDFYFGQYVATYQSLKDLMRNVARFEERRASSAPARRQE